MSDARMRALERQAALGLADPIELAAARARWRTCCRGTGWSAPWTRCLCGLPPSAEEWDSWLPPAVDRIDEPLPEELLAEQRERWLAIGLATGPSDRLLAEAGIRDAYRAAGLAPPERLVWLPSPLAGVIAAAAEVSEDRVAAGVSETWTNRVWDQVRNRVRDSRGTRIRDLVRDALGPLGLRGWNTHCGSHDAHWLSSHHTLLLAGLRAPTRLRGRMWAAMACGWWWSFRRVAIVTERPSAIERGRGGWPTRIVYPDGWEVRA